jgi:hypothetical protein
MNNINELTPREPVSNMPLMTALARELVASIPRGKERQQAFLVLRKLADAALEAGEGQMTSKRLATKEIAADIRLDEEPSKLLSRCWKTLKQPSGFPALKENLIRRCREAGLSYYPEPCKEGGTPAYYYLAAEPLPPADVLPDGARSARPQGEGLVRYEADMALRLSRFGSWVFRKGLLWSSRVRYFVVGGFSAALAVLGVLSALAIWAFSQRRDPLSISDVVTLVIVVGLPLWAFRWIDEKTRIFDDRIVIAPEWALAWSEDGATLEIERASDGQAPSTMHVRRYTAVCPVCSGVVKVRAGEPEFPRRLVGRCAENPREHVFGFDRVTLIGDRINLPGVSR